MSLTALIYERASRKERDLICCRLFGTQVSDCLEREFLLKTNNDTHTYTPAASLGIREECDEVRRSRKTPSCVSVCMRLLDRIFQERKSQTVDDAFSPQTNRGKQQRDINMHAVVGLIEAKLNVIIIK